MGGGIPGRARRVGRAAGRPLSDASDDGLDPGLDPGRDGAPDDGLTRALAGLAGRGSLLLALDFDGVCAPLVDDPARSRMLPGTRAALLALADAGCRVALVSGRSLESLLDVARPDPGWLVVGGHGAEVAGGRGGAGRLSQDQAVLLAHVGADVEALVAGAPGSRVEHKPTAVVLHTRLADTDVAAAVAAAVLAGPGARPGVHVRRGHDVVELAVVVVDKGTALQALRTQVHARAVLYAGDDVTDEDAFAVLDPEAGDVGVKVGPGPTAAGYRVAAPAQVTGLLERLLREIRGRA